jgi:Nif-specific regulatory protein
VRLLRGRAILYNHGGRLPRLIGTSGEAIGIDVTLEHEVTIGRHSDCDVFVNDAAASRFHCRIVRVGSTWVIIDGESSNGTWVDNEAVSGRRDIADGDSIRVGNSVFCFCIDSGPSKPAADDSWVPQPTAIMGAYDVRRMSSELLASASPADERTNNNLHALLGVGKLLRCVGSVSALHDELFMLIADALPAQGGAVVLMGYSDRDPEVSCTWNRDAHAYGPVSMSRTLVDRVISEGVAILADGPSAHDIAGVESLMARGIVSVICVPLLVQDVVHGAIYLETADPGHPFDYRDLEMLTAIAGYAALAFDHAHRIELLQKENARLRSHAAIRHTMVGDSPAMRQLCERIRKIAQTDATVLITGESGTGKELTARAVHMNSHRLSGPFEAINCALLRDTLLESELFGHEKGAFTGAVSQKRGRLELAGGGTVFLDEIGDLPDKPQAMLLRVLQEREFLRLGGTQPIRVDIRLIAATNKDLEQAVKDKEFRQDLFYRLSVICLRLPALRDRREDIPTLARHFVQQAAQRNKKPIARVSPPAMALLMRYPWPGNIRELENTIEYGVIFASTDEVLPEDLPESIHGIAEDGKPVSNYTAAVRKAREKIVLNAMRQANWSYTEAAAQLGIHVNNLHRLIRELNLKSRIPHSG